MKQSKEGTSSTEDKSQDVRTTSSVHNNSCFRQVNSLYSDKEDLKSPSQLSEATCSTGIYRIEVSLKQSKQSKPDCNPRCSGENSLSKTKSLYDDTGKQHPHHFKTTRKRTDSSFCDIDGFATSFTYLLIILSCFLCYTIQSYVATFGYGVYGQLGIENIAIPYTPSLAETINLLPDVTSVVGCYKFTLILAAAGQVFGVGYNNYGQLGLGTTSNQPYPILIPSLSNIEGIGCGQYHSLFWNSSGIYGSGYNYYGQLGLGSTANSYIPVLIPRLNSVKGATGGDYSSYVWNTTGSLFTFGYNYYGQLSTGDTNSLYSPFLVNISNIVQVAAGPFHFLAIDSFSRLFGCGDNYGGQLGVGITGNQYLNLIQIPIVGSAVSASAGVSNGFVLTNNSQVYGFGDNVYGELGVGSFGGSFSSPTLVTSLSDITQICACQYHTNFLTKAGNVYAAGINGVGQLGLGDFVNRNIPTQLTTLSNVTSIVCGRSFTFANPPPQMYSWGQNYYGETGLNYTIGIRSTLQWVGTLNGLPVKDIGAFYYDTFYLLENGTLLGNGNNENGQLAQGNIANMLLPTSIPLQSVTQIPVGYDYGIYLNESGAYGAGDNSYGKLGLGSSSGPFLNPVLIASDIVLTGSGPYHSFIVNSSGAIFGMGYNYFSQLCLGDTTDMNVPTMLNISYIPLKAIACGYGTSIFLTSSGDVLVCGYNGNGQLGLSYDASQVPYAIENPVFSGTTIIAASAAGTFTIVANFTMALIFGTGSPYPTYYGLPTQIVGVTNILEVTIGYDHVLILSQNAEGIGIVYSFGSNNYGQLGLGNNITQSSPVQISLPRFNVTAVAAGVSHSVTLYNCINGYGGHNCAYPTCYGILYTSLSVCSGNGNCTAPDQCQCNSGYVGSSCEFAVCYNVPSNDSINVCSGNGNCTLPDQCECNSGYVGPTCQIPACYNVPSNDTLNVCSGNGNCTSPDKCQCQFQYGGNQCQYSYCFNIPGNSAAVCSSHGNCTAPDACLCDTGFSGSNCSIGGSGVISSASQLTMGSVHCGIALILFVFLIFSF